MDVGGVGGKYTHESVIDVIQLQAAAGCLIASLMFTNASARSVRTISTVSCCFVPAGLVWYLQFTRQMLIKPKYLQIACRLAKSPETKLCNYQLLSVTNSNWTAVRR